MVCSKVLPAYRSVPLRCLLVILLAAVPALPADRSAVPMVRHAGIVIDGAIDDFDKSRPIILNTAAQIGWKLDEWRGTNDLSATAFINYDDEFIYVAVSVTDDVLMNRYYDAYNVSIWNGDCVEIFLSSSFSSKRTNKAYGTGDLQIMLMPPVGGKASYIVKARDGAVWTEALAVEKAAITGVRTADGYMLEVRIPFYALNRSGRNDIGDLGVNIGILDADIEKARLKMTVNGRNDMPSALTGFIPAAFIGERPRSRSVFSFDPAFIGFGVIALVLYAAYVLAMRTFIVRSMLQKRRILIAAAAAAAVLGGLLFITAQIERRFFALRIGRTAALADDLLRGIAASSVGSVDIRTLPDRMLTIISNGSLSRRVDRRSVMLKQRPHVIRDDQGIAFMPATFDNHAFMVSSCVTNASAAYVYAAPTYCFPGASNRVVVGEMVFSGTETNMRLRFTNGENLINTSYFFSMRTNVLPPGISAAVGVRYKNYLYAGSVHGERYPSAMYRYRVPLSVGVLTNVRYAGLSNYVVGIRGITVETPAGYSHIDSESVISISWNGTWYRSRYTAYENMDFLRGTRSRIHFSSAEPVDEVRLVYDMPTDAISYGSFSAGATIASVSVSAQGRTAAARELVDGVNCDAATLVGGYGHPGYFTSSIASIYDASTGIRPAELGKHADEISLRLPSASAVDVVIERRHPAAMLSVSGAVGVRYGDFQGAYVSNSAIISDGERYVLSPDAVRHFTGVKTGVFFAGDLTLPGFSRTAAEFTRAYFIKFPPGRQTSFCSDRTIDGGDEEILVVPYKSHPGGYAFPAAFVFSVSRAVSFVFVILRAFAVAAAAVTIVLLALYATHFLVDGKRLTVQMSTYSVIITVLPMLVTAVVFINAYNAAMRTMLTGAVIDKQHAVLEEVRSMRSELGQFAEHTLRKAPTASNDALFTLTHRAGGDGMPTVRFSENTPAQFRIAPTARLLRQSDVVFNSLFGLVLAETAARTGADGVDTVTAFRVLDAPLLARLKQKVHADIGVHYWHGYPFVSTLSSNTVFPVPETGTEDFLASGRNIAMYTVNGTPYMTMIFPLVNTRGFGAAHLSVAVDASAAERTKWLIVSIIVLISIVIAAFTWLISNWLTGVISKSVAVLSSGMQRVEDGDLKVSVSVEAKNELGYLADRFNAMVRGLLEKTQIEKHAKELEELNTRLRHASEIYGKDLKMASAVQQKMLMPSPPAVSGYDIAFAYLPSSGVSGDLYDIYVERGELAGVLVADVSGHGIASGLLTTLAKPIMFKMFMSRGERPLAEVLSAINREVIAAKGDIENYLTAVMIAVKGDVIEWVNCGHVPMLHRKNGSVVRVPEKDGSGTMLGVAGMEDFFDSTVHADSFVMAPGDVLVLLTDGITEAKDAAGKELDLAAVSAVLAALPGAADAAAVSAAVIEAAKRHCAGAFTDDCTIVVIKRRQ